MASDLNQVPRKRSYPLLHNGDCMTRAEFHRAYSQMPERYRAELIGGIVFEPSPVGPPHARDHIRLGYLLETYSRYSPGTDVLDNVSVVLGDEDEVHPDLCLRVVPESGGRSRAIGNRYVKGAPELVAELAHSSRAIDLHLKKERYTLASVLEYMVMCLSPREIYWFDLTTNTRLQADHDGVFRSVVFPGLWIPEDGLLQSDREMCLEILGLGLQSPEHKEFVSRLAGDR